MSRSRVSGKVNFFGLLMVLALIVGVYVVAMVAPVYLDNMDVQKAIQAAINQPGGKNDDGAMRRFIKYETRTIGSHVETDGSGEPVEQAGLGLTDDQISIERTASEATIQIDYERAVNLKLLGRTVRMQFHPRKTGPLQQ